MAATAALLFLLGSFAGEARPDAVAELLTERCLALGIDLNPDNPKASHPSADDVRALSRAGASSWLDAQISSAEDSIAEPPATLRDFLRDHHGALWSVIGVLEKQNPEPLVKAGSTAMPRLLPFVRLEKLLLAAALAEARNGNTFEAERALEASWSLGRSFASGHYLLSQLLGNAVERWQAGVLRKLPAAPFSWINRLSSDSPWTRMLDGMAEEGTLTDPTLGSPSMDPSRALRARAFAALADGLRKVSPCELPDLSEEDIWRPAADVYRLETSEEARGRAAAHKEMLMPSFLSGMRRAGRLVVDRELTLKVLELRFERAASREGDWPAEFENLGSSVCPGALYAYRSDGESMEIRFEGQVSTPDAGVVLPLVFRSGAGPTAAPAPAPSPTPTGPERLDSSEAPEP